MDLHLHLPHGCDLSWLGHLVGCEIRNLEQRIMATLEETLEKVRANGTVLGSINTLLDGLRTEVREVLSGARIPPAVQAKVDAIFNAATAQGTELDEVLLENTPAEPPSP